VWLIDHCVAFRYKDINININKWFDIIKEFLFENISLIQLNYFICQWGVIGMLSVIFGGSGSGKSEYAEDYVVQCAKNDGSRQIYIATMQPFGEETMLRIQKHKRMRQDKNFITIECFTDLKKVEVEPHTVILLECMSNLAANEMFSDNGAGKDTIEEIMFGVNQLIQRSVNVVIVTNNIFEDGYSYDSTTLEYMKTLGEINRRICKQADQLIEVVHGIPIIIKGNLNNPNRAWKLINL